MTVLSKTDDSSGVGSGRGAPGKPVITGASPAKRDRKNGRRAPKAEQTQKRRRLNGNLARRCFPRSAADYTVWDNELPGFGLRVRKSGGRGSWIVIVYRRRKRLRLTLGRCGVVSADWARREARAALAEAALDGLPKPPLAVATVTLADYADEFTRDYARHWKASTAHRNAGVLRRELIPAFGSCPVGELQRTDISRWRDSFAGPREATFNRAVPVLSVMLQYAEQLGYRRKGSNPCRGVARYKRQLPERYLSPEEYRRLGRRMAEVEREHPTDVAILRLLLFTGARVGEITGLEWSWIRPGRLILPDSKTGPKIIHLNRPAEAVLAAVPRQADTELVFPSRHSRRAYSLNRFWYPFRRSCALPDVRLHDLRHSFASTAIAENVSLALIGKLLGHELPETTARYAHLADETVADAVQRVSGSLAGHLGLRR